MSGAGLLGVGIFIGVVGVLLAQIAFDRVTSWWADVVAAIGYYSRGATTIVLVVAVVFMFGLTQGWWKVS